MIRCQNKSFIYFTYHFPLFPWLLNCIFGLICLIQFKTITMILIKCFVLFLRYLVVIGELILNHRNRTIFYPVFFCFNIKIALSFWLNQVFLRRRTRSLLLIEASITLVVIIFIKSVYFLIDLHLVIDISAFDVCFGTDHWAGYR